MSRKITDKQRLDWLDARGPWTGSCVVRWQEFKVYAEPIVRQPSGSGKTIRQAIDRAIRSEKNEKKSQDN